MKMIKPIINTLLVLSVLISTIKSECVKFKDSSYCEAYVSKEKKKSTYFSTNAFKNQGVELKDVSAFDAAMSKINFNPIYPADVSFMEKQYGCKYEATQFKVRYAESYQCNTVFHELENGCNKNIKGKLPKLCKSSCLVYLDIVKSIFNDTINCPIGLNVQAPLIENRQKRIEEIQKHCNTYTDDSSDCLTGTGSEGEFCGFTGDKDREEHCVVHLNDDPCCSVDRKPGTNYFKIAVYIFAAAGVLLVVVLIVLKVYSTKKNQRDEQTRIETEALEKKRQEERERYREQLSKEVSSDSLNIPLLERNGPEASGNSPYQSPQPQPQRPSVSSQDSLLGSRSPRPPAAAARGPQSPNPIIPPRTRDSPGSNASRPPPPHDGSRDSPSSNASRPPPQRNGSRDSPGSNASRPPPQHNGSRGSPGSNASRPPPQHNGSRGSPGSNASRPPPGPRDSPRNSPNHPPHPPQGGSGRYSPRNSPSHPPPHGPRGSPGNRNSPGSRPPPPGGNGRPHLPSNNNRY